MVVVKSCAVFFVYETYLINKHCCIFQNKFSSLFSQSQFRFDNECYLNLPENHKRVSVTQAPIKAIDDRRTSQEDTRIQPIDVKESNFNLDDFNIASVSMPDFYLFNFINLSFPHFIMCLNYSKLFFIPFNIFQSPTCS